MTRVDEALGHALFNSDVDKLKLIDFFFVYKELW